MRRLNKLKEKQTNPGRPTPSNGGLSALKEAEILQKRGERKRGLEAVPVCEKAAEAFREALACTPPDNLATDQQASAHFGLAATLQYAADCILTGSRCAADEDVKALEESARLTARQLLQQSVLEYKQVREVADGGSMRTDALVDCGNALSGLADLTEHPGEALELLGEAVEAYRAALAQEEDAITYSNLADSLVSRADQLSDIGQAAEARDEYGKAMKAYAAACGMSSSEAGDDLPGLLYNWGVGLHSAGTHLIDPVALTEAAEKLKAAKDFERGDAMVMNALGDTFVSMAEMAPDPTTQQGLLQNALSEGYSAALRIDRYNSDALVGTAEVEMHLGKGGTGTGDEGMTHFQRSAQAYSTALQNPRKLGGYKDRCEVRYNFACASCLAGQPRGAEGTLQLLLNSGGVTMNELLEDPDLEQLHASAWVQASLNSKDP